MFVASGDPFPGPKLKDAASYGSQLHTNTSIDTYIATHTTFHNNFSINYILLLEITVSYVIYTTN